MPVSVSAATVTPGPPESVLLTGPRVAVALDFAKLEAEATGAGYALWVTLTRIHRLTQIIFSMNEDLIQSQGLALVHSVAYFNHTNKPKAVSTLRRQLYYARNVTSTTLLSDSGGDSDSGKEPLLWVATHTHEFDGPRNSLLNIQDIQVKTALQLVVSKLEELDCLYKRLIEKDLGPKFQKNHNATTQIWRLFEKFPPFPTFREKFDRLNELLTQEGLYSSEAFYHACEGFGLVVKEGLSETRLEEMIHRAVYREKVYGPDSDSANLASDKFTSAMLSRGAIIEFDTKINKLFVSESDVRELQIDTTAIDNDMWKHTLHPQLLRSGFFVTPPSGAITTELFRPADGVLSGVKFRPAEAIKAHEFIRSRVLESGTGWPCEKPYFDEIDYADGVRKPNFDDDEIDYADGVRKLSMTDTPDILIAKEEDSSCVRRFVLTATFD